MKKIRINRNLTHMKLFEFQKWARDNGIPVVEIHSSSLGHTYMGSSFSLRLYGSVDYWANTPPEFFCTLLIRDQDFDLVSLRL